MCFTMWELQIFVGYAHSYLLDSRVVLPPSRGTTWKHKYGFWMNSSDVGRSAYIQLGVDGILVEFNILRCLVLFALRSLIHIATLSKA